MGEFGLWFSALIGQWQFMISAGGFIGFLLIILYFTETFCGWTIPKLWYALFVIFLVIIIASFLAWKDEHRQVNAKDQVLTALQKRLKSPEFRGQIDNIITGKLNGQPLVVLEGTIWNSTGPSSSLINWKMTIEFPDGKRIEGEVPFGTGKHMDVAIPTGGAELFAALQYAKFWPEGASQPIVEGAVLNGWFWSTFSKLDLNEAYGKKAKVIVQFEDVREHKKHTLSASFEEKGIHLPTANMPKG